MNSPVDIFFRPVEPGQVPYWRLVLRGCSQTCFQSNELTGLIFFVAVLIASPIAFAYLLVAAIMAPGGRMLLGKRDAIPTGLPGLNPCLIALALPAAFHTGFSDIGMWGVLVVSVAATMVLTRVSIVLLPVPTLAFPFLLVFWALVALAPRLDVLQPITSSPAGPEAFHPFAAVCLSLGQAIFAGTVWSGLLFLGGVLLSNWRHGLLALFGAAIGTVVSYYHRDVDIAGVNLGQYGFNGVLTAVAVFIFCGGKLRLAILGSVLATMMVPALASLGLPTASAPYVFTTWLMLGLGWIADKWFDLPTAPALSSESLSAHP